MLVKLTRKDAQEIADRYAKDACDNHFQHRRGVWDLGDGKLLVYNNNPYGSYPTARLEEVERIKKSLKDLGIKVLAKGQYGEETRGCDELYTVTLLLEADADRVSEVAEIVGKESEETMKMIYENARKK